MKILFIGDRANHLSLFAKVLFFKRSIFEFSVAETLLMSFHFLSSPDLVFLFLGVLFHLADRNYFLVYIFERCSPASSSKEPFLSKIRYNFRNQQFA